MDSEKTRGCRFLHLQEEGKPGTSHKPSGLRILQDRIQTPKSPGPFGRKWYKPLENLKDELGLLRLHFLSYARLVRVLSNMEKVYPGLKLGSKGVVTPVDKLRKTPLDYISNVLSLIHI